MRRRAVFAIILFGTAGLGIAGCRSASDLTAAGTLSVRPTAVSCTAGDRVEIAVSGARPVEFEALGGGVWLTDVERDRGTAMLSCEAAGRYGLRIRAAGQLLDMPVSVQPPPPGTLQLSAAPSPLTLVSGVVELIRASVVSSRPGVSTAVRFRTADTTLIVVDSIAGTVRAVANGTTSVVVQAYADPTIAVVVPVTVTRGSAIVIGIAPDQFIIQLRVGDSTVLRSTLFLAVSAPTGTSRAVTYVSSNPDIARVTSAGALRAVAAGTTTIIASSVAAPLIRTTISVTVREPPP